MFNQPFQNLIPYIYFLFLLSFLFLYAFFITVQLYDFIKLEWLYNKLNGNNVNNENMDHLFNLLKVLLYKRLWFTSIQHLEKQRNIPEAYMHQYFNAIGFIYYSMRKYDLAKLYYLRSLSKKDSYITAWQNLSKVYERVKDIS